MSNERRRRELEVLSAADALVGLWDRLGWEHVEGMRPEPDALRNAMLALRSFEDDEAVAEAAYDRAVAGPLPEGATMTFKSLAEELFGLDKGGSMPPGQAFEPTLDDRVGRLEDRVSYERLESIEKRLAAVEERLRPATASQHAWPQPDVLPAGAGDDQVWVVCEPGWMVMLDEHGRRHAAQLPPHGPEGVVAVDELALRKLCRELAIERWFRQPTPRTRWRGDGEEVRLVWDEFLSGHDARLLP